MILVDYPGVGSSTGEPNRTIASTAKWIIALVDTPGAARIDPLGISMGGCVAQDIALGLGRR